MLSTEIAAKITAEGWVATGYTIFRDVTPDSPNKVIAIYGQGGFEPDLFMGDGATVENPGLQIVVRGDARDADGPHAQIDTIYQGLTALGAFTQSGVRYLTVQPRQSPFPMKRDANERVYYAVNFLVMRELS